MENISWPDHISYKYLNYFAVEELNRDSEL